MFNSYSSSVKINAVTGAILKNHPKSWFERFHLNSSRADKLLQEGGHKYLLYGEEHKPEKDIVILQMVICGDMEVMAELIYRKDYELKEGAE